MLRFFIKLFYPNYQAKHHTTVRYAFSFVFLTTIFAGLAAVTTQNSSYISLQVSDDKVTQDQQFYVDVTISAHVPINAVDIILTYPEEFLVIDSIDVGTSVISLWNKNPYAENGKIYMQGGTFRKGFVGNHQVARIRAHAVKSGDARIILQSTKLIAGDGNGTSVNATNDGVGIVSLAITGSDGVLTAEAQINVVTDVDNDNDVDMDDVSKFMAAWISRKFTFDFNNDGRMTFIDFSILLAESFYH
ncbi:MAG TPA: hypothetical protein VFV22_02090 [Candidatus Paceibacterota bacterium]|nr:hypothetical protein [Candidatus Paceibacterota bacterium]